MTAMTSPQTSRPRSRTTSAAGVLAVATVMAVVPVASAHAASARHGGDTVRSNGGCSGSAVWKLKAKHDNSNVEVEYEVDSNRSGQTWTVRLKDNGERFFAGKLTTAGASGSFTVHKLTADRTGDDVIRARATHGNQVCHGKVTV
jgi:hypothetical protein